MNSKLNFQILIATMNRENFDFLYKMFPHHDLNKLDILIVNQTTEDKLLNSNLGSVKVFNSFQKGLSKSRNLAFKNATANWCLIADDDLIYLKNFEYNILEGIKMFTESGIITFEAIIDENNSLRNYPLLSKSTLSVYENLNVGSIEMLINRKQVNNKVEFNKLFGLSSGVFNSGEEQVFIFDLIHKLKFKTSFYKSQIVQHSAFHTGRDYEIENRYFTKGGLYAQIFPSSYKKWIFTQLFYDVKQGHVTLFNVVKRYKEALQGVKKLKKIKNEAYKK